MDIYKLMLLAEEEENNPMDGMFSGAQHIVGIVLIITGLLIIYIAVKIAKGYRFLPAAGSETIIEEDNYVEGEAKAVSKQTTTLPDYGSGAKELTEWEISYTVNDEEFTQVMPDDGYETGDTITRKYDPTNASDCYLVTDDAPSKEGGYDDSDDTANSRRNGFIFGLLGVIVMLGGIALALL